MFYIWYTAYAVGSLNFLRVKCLIYNFQHLIFNIEYTLSNIKFALEVDPNNIKIQDEYKHVHELMKSNKPYWNLGESNEIE